MVGDADIIFIVETWSTGSLKHELMQEKVATDFEAVEEPRKGAKTMKGKTRGGGVALLIRKALFKYP